MSRSKVVAIFFLLVLFSTAGYAIGIDSKNNSIALALSGEPPTLNAIESSAVTSNFILTHVMGCLTRVGKRGAVPDAAESWVQDNERQYTFHLRKDGRWSDGKPVTAADFVFAWQQAIRPKSTTPFVSSFFDIKNAEAIHRGEKPMSDLGVQALDDYTLQVQLEYPVNFPYRAAVVYFAPIREDFFTQRGSQYGSEAEQVLYNGPFMVTEWKHDTRIVMKKNPLYWNAENIRLDEIRLDYLTPDQGALLNLYRDGQIAATVLDAEAAARASDQGLRIRTSKTNNINYLFFNTRKAPLNNLSLRRALRAVIDRDVIANKVIQVPGTRPVYSFLLPGDWAVRTYLDEPPWQDTFDPAAAKQFIAEARKVFPNGKIPAFSILVLDSAARLKFAEYLQGLFKQSLDLDVKVDAQTFKQALAKAYQREFDIILISYQMFEAEPVEAGRLMLPEEPVNFSGFNSETFTSAYLAYRNSIDPAIRKRALIDMQRSYDEAAPSVPIVNIPTIYLQDDRLKGVLRVPATLDYSGAWIAQ